MPDPLSEQLKKLIIELLRLEDVTPGDISDDEPLVGAGLALDSLDMLELVVRLEKDFGIKLRSSEESKEAMASVARLAAYIRQHGDPAKLPT